MSDIAHIEARLEGLGQLGELVGALRSMAASRVREAQKALSGTEAFCATIDGAMTRLSPTLSEELPDRRSKSVLVAITSENGFVGGFNTRIMEHVRDLRGAEETLFVIGRRGQILAMEMNLPVGRTFPMTARAEGVTQLARRIAAQMARVTRARIVFASRAKNGAFDVISRQVLPLSPARGEGVGGTRPLHYLLLPELLEQLASEYLFAEIAHACMISLVSENNARLMIMDSASRNIDDHLDNLRRVERTARQNQETADMLDVIVGSEAVHQD